MNLNLYVDIGNTQIKFGYFWKKWHFFQIMNSKNLTATILHEKLQLFLEKIEIKKIYISSVVSRIDEIIKEWNRNFIFKPLVFFSGKSSLSLKIDPKVKNTIGADIVANAFYAASKYEEAIIISLGTATVISHIKNKQLLGSIISPGLMSSFYFLTNYASGLNPLALRFLNKKLANNTQDALSIGFINGFCYMLKGFIKELNTEAKLLLTGGDSHYLATPLGGEIVDHMVLKGLKEFAENGN